MSAALRDLICKGLNTADQLVAELLTVAMDIRGSRQGLADSVLVPMWVQLTLPPSS